jgi:uncharacterized membrane protein YdbT with pleckstrin-like domain
MSYVDRHLAPGEQVVFRTRLHPIVFGSALSFAAFVLGVVALIVVRNDLPPESVRLLWLSGAVLAFGSLVPPYLRWRTSEFAVTDRRVLVKTGLLSVHSLEVLLPKVEAIGVDQPLSGRLLGFGTLRISGTGGTVEEFDRVARPDRLREAVVRQAPASPVARAR